MKNLNVTYTDEDHAIMLKSKEKARKKMKINVLPWDEFLFKLAERGL